MRIATEYIVGTEKSPCAKGSASSSARNSPCSNAWLFACTLRKPRPVSAEVVMEISSKVVVTSAAVSSPDASSVSNAKT